MEDISVIQVEEIRNDIALLMRAADRSTARGEARFAVLEAALHLLRLDDRQPPPGTADDVEPLRDALAAARAAVVATNHALVRACDARRLAVRRDLPTDRAPIAAAPRGVPAGHL